jgi:GTP-binding protein Era
VNWLVGRKVSITSSRPQTTRNLIRGVVNQPGSQMVLVDTPGLHKPRTELGNRLNRLVYGTLKDADAVAFLVDATQPVGTGDRLIVERLKQAECQVVLVVTKTDIASRAQVTLQLTEAAGWDFAAYVPVSAVGDDGHIALLQELEGFLPEGHPYFPEGMVSDQPEEYLVAELVREKFLDRLRDELPHSLTVRVDEMTTRPDGLLHVAASVIVERDSQKGIVIGDSGAMLKVAGTEARIELESLFATRVFLDLRVRIEPDWQRRPALLDRLGFSDR